MSIIKKPWSYKPDSGREILDSSHPIIDKDLLGVFIAQHRGTGFRNVLNGDVSTYAGSSIPSSTDDALHGPGRTSAAASDSRENFSDSRYTLEADSHMSVALWFRVPSWNSDQGPCGIWVSGEQREWVFWTTTTTNRFELLVRSGAGNVGAGVTNAETYNGQLVGVVGTYDKINVKIFMRHYDDGTSFTDSSATTGDFEAPTTVELALGNYSSPSTSFAFDGGSIYTLAYSKRAWTDAEALDILDRPFAYWKPRSLMVTAAAAAAVYEQLSYRFRYDNNADI